MGWDFFKLSSVQREKAFSDVLSIQIEHSDLFDHTFSPKQCKERGCSSKSYRGRRWGEGIGEGGGKIPRKAPEVSNHTGCLQNWKWINKGFPGDASGKEPTCLFRRHKIYGFDPRGGKIPWITTWKSTPILFPGESHGQRSLEGYSS